MTRPLTLTREEDFVSTDRLNPEKYRAHAQGLGLPESHVDEVIHIVRSLMQPFVDAAFGLHPVQQIERPERQNQSRTQEELGRINNHILGHESAGPPGENG